MEQREEREVRGTGKLLLALWLLKADFSPRFAILVRISAGENMVHQAGNLRRMF